MKKLFMVLSLVALYLSMAIYLGCNWALANFAFTSFDEILYTLTSPFLNAGQNLIPNFIIKNLIFPLVIIIGIIFIIVIYNIYNKKYNINVDVRIFNFKFKFDLFNNKIFKITKIFLYIIPFILLSFSTYKLGNDLLFFDYIKNASVESNFFANEYVNPEDVKITFPKKKRNLIYIYLESMESTFSSIKNGGKYKINYIPNLTDIANDNITFSDTSNLGGARQVYGTGFTIAGMVSQSAGVPLKSVFDGNSLAKFYTVLFPGAYSLGEILAVNGYKNYIMFGSDAEFAGRDNYFKNHGNYEILDYYKGINDGIIASNYFKNWGFEDEILYNYAKEKLTEISKEDEPFNFTLLTVDTHTPDGFTSDFCENVSDNEYLNSIYCADKQIGDFIMWLQDQDFYDNTTIVVVGDHLSMNTYSFDNIDYYERRVYNAFINAKVKDNAKLYNNRLFTSFDIYPTTLAALNVQIEGNKLALGVNLFSEEQTLIERYGYEYVNEELAKRSIFYDECILNNMCG